MNKSKSPLASLLVDAGEVTDELVKELLGPYLGLSADEDKIVPNTAFTQLPQSKRILLYLVSRHAMVRLGIPGSCLEAQAEKIASSCLIPLKSCRELLSRLKAAGLVVKGQGGYSIPVHSLLRVAGELRKAKSE